MSVVQLCHHLSSNGLIHRSDFFTACSLDWTGFHVTAQLLEGERWRNSLGYLLTIVSNGRFLSDVTLTSYASFDTRMTSVDLILLKNDLSSVTNNFHSSACFRANQDATGKLTSKRAKTIVKGVPLSWVYVTIRTTDNICLATSISIKSVSLTQFQIFSLLKSNF